MATASVIQALPAAGWRATAGRDSLTRNSAILALAVALHIAAAAALTKAGPEHRPTARSGPAVITLQLIAAVADKEASALVPTRQTTRARVNAPARPQVPRAVDSAPRLDNVQTADAAQKAGEAPVQAAVREPEPQLARRSLAFGGGTAQRDELAPIRGSTRPLDGWLQDGIARSVWPVAQELASAADGVCRVVRSDARIVCSAEALDAALARIPQDAQRALASWVQSGFAQEIEIRIDDGAARYVVRTD